MFRYKIDQNHTNNEEFDFFEGRERGGGGLTFLNFNLDYYL